MLLNKQTKLNIVMITITYLYLNQILALNNFWLCGMILNKHALHYFKQVYLTYR